MFYHVFFEYQGKTHGFDAPFTRLNVASECVRELRKRGLKVWCSALSCAA